MSEKINFAEHPAFLAWREIDPGARVPERIEELNLKKKKSTVFRLYGLGPNKQNIVAKQGKTKNLVNEKFIYENILTNAHFSCLEYYGFKENPQTNTSWMFLEDAQGVDYIHSNKNHRKAILKWLAELHSSRLDQDQIDSLPDRSLVCYFHYLDFAQIAIIKFLNTAELSKDQIKIIHRIDSRLNVIAHNRENLEVLYKKIPLLFIHGDIKKRNFQISKIDSEYKVLPFDWEMAGWGVPFKDLATISQNFSTGDLKYYWSLVSTLPKIVDVELIHKLLYTGRILRLIAAVYWISLGFEKESHRSPVRNYIFDGLQQCENYFLNSFRKLNWNSEL